MKTLIHIEDVEAIVDKLIDSDSEAATFMIELRKRLVAEEEAEKKEKAPRKKYDLIGLVMDTDPTALVENEVFVLKVEEGTDHNEVPNKIRAVIRDHNVKANANKQARDISNGFALATKSGFKNQQSITLVDREPMLLVLAKDTLTDQ
tara:strand:+ start:3337 stop:3780 length:444 start_codon:yes stop_codon:yes gene_type:complete